MPNVQWRTPDDGQRNCPKHVDFLDKSKFEKQLVRLLVLLENSRAYFKSLQQRNIDVVVTVIEMVPY